MAISAFPPVEHSDPHGLLAVGGDLEIESLLLAYRSGIFPWPIGRTLAWFAPPHRTVLFFDRFHISRRLHRTRRDGAWQFSIDRCFDRVISACASAPRDGEGTWISPSLQRAYLRLHEAGYAHSVESWYEGELAGGIYGVSIGGMFAGESMFFRRRDASKLALWHLVTELQGRGASWIDCQVMNPHLARLGACEIPRREYLALLDTALHAPTPLFALTAASETGQITWNG